MQAFFIPMCLHFIYTTRFYSGVVRLLLSKAKYQGKAGEDYAEDVKRVAKGTQVYGCLPCKAFRRKQTAILQYGARQGGYLPR